MITLLTTIVIATAERPIDPGQVNRLVLEVTRGRTGRDGRGRGSDAAVDLETTTPSRYFFRVRATRPCLPEESVCSSLIGHFSVDRVTADVFDEDRKLADPLALATADMRLDTMFTRVAMSPSSAPPGACRSTRLSGVTVDRSSATPIVLSTTGGERLKVLGQDFIDPRRWRSGDALKVCSQPGPPRTVEIIDVVHHEHVVAMDAEPLSQPVGDPSRQPVVSHGSEASIYESGEPSGRMPALGSCFKAKVKTVTTRLVGLPQSGTTILYRDGHAQVSYDRIAAAEQTKVGDVVRLCADSLPSTCLPGDFRGVVYRSTDLRTGRTWLMPNAEHQCGGG